MPTSKIVYLGELRTQATHLYSNNTIITDAPLDNNGRAEAFSPTDLVATALGSCAMTVMGIVAQRDEIDFTGSTVEITKIMTTELPRKIAEVVVNFKILTPEPLPQAIQDKYIRIAHTCPVALSLKEDVKQMMNFEWESLVVSQ